MNLRLGVFFFCGVADAKFKVMLVQPAFLLRGNFLFATFYTGLPSGQFGARFSLWERTPSWGSLPAKPRNSSASEVSKVGPIWRSQLFSACLVKRIALCAPVARASDCHVKSVA